MNSAKYLTMQKTPSKEQINTPFAPGLKQNMMKKKLRSRFDQFIFTFLGQIIFVYFLLRKGWIEGKRDYIRKIVEDPQKSNLYLDFFTPLFLTSSLKNPAKDHPRFNNNIKTRHTSMADFLNIVISK